MLFLLPGLVSGILQLLAAPLVSSPGVVGLRLVLALLAQAVRSLFLVRCDDDPDEATVAAIRLDDAHAVEATDQARVAAVERDV